MANLSSIRRESRLRRHRRVRKKIYGTATRYLNEHILRKAGKTGKK